MSLLKYLISTIFIVSSAVLSHFNFLFAEKYRIILQSLPANLDGLNNSNSKTLYDIPEVLVYSMGGFVLLEILLWILFKCFQWKMQYFNTVYTLIFCVFNLNIGTYLLTDLFEKYTKVGGITQDEYEQLMVYKINFSYFAISYFAIDLIFNTKEIDFILHHIAAVIYLMFHHKLNDMIMLFCLLFGEITNPILLIWRASKKDFPQIHYQLSPINLVLFILIRVFVGIGICYHSTLKYHRQTQSELLNFLNWTIFIGFNIGNFYWCYKIIRSYLTEKNNNKFTIYNEYSQIERIIPGKANTTLNYSSY
jgi:hypothetical protein